MRSTITCLMATALHICICLVGQATATEPVVRVVVWDEQQPAQKQAYDHFLGNAIANHLTAQPGLRVISTNLGEPDKGLPTSLLDSTDVIIWWGHVKHDDISQRSFA